MFTTLISTSRFEKYQIEIYSREKYESIFSHICNCYDAKRFGVVPVSFCIII